MLNLKNITDLPVADSIEGLNLIANDNGSAKQIPASSVGKVKTVNGVNPDESGNVQIDTASSWNDLKDKPFYDARQTVVIEWDGNASGWCKVSDLTPPLSVLEAATGTFYIFGSTSNISNISFNIDQFSDGNVMVSSSYGLMVVYAEKTYGENHYESGIYFCTQEGGGIYIKSLSFTEGELRKLDVKYLPGSVLVFELSPDDYWQIGDDSFRSDKNYDPIYEAVLAKTPVFIAAENVVQPILRSEIIEGEGLHTYVFYLDGAGHLGQVELKFRQGSYH